MTAPVPVDFLGRARKDLGSTKVAAVAAGMGKFSRHRATAVAEYGPMDEMRDRARRIRIHTLSNLDRYLAELADRVEANGGLVWWAADAAEAVEHVRRIADEHQARLVIKSKSMVTEEIELNHGLGLDGIEVVETDLGEFIVQLSDDRPSHIIAPVLHRTRQEIGRLFAEKLGAPYTEVSTELNQIARSYLRRIFLQADMGISGVNFAVAESGTVVTVTNEGNGRLTTTAPRVHVAIMGMERVVPTFSDVSVLLEVLARSATGQRLSVYTNLVSGPRRPGEPDGPDEFHLIVLDNGRSQMLGGELAEILACIRCGACLNACPVYGQVGGHAYGSVYSGPVGAVVTPGLFGMDPWWDLPLASTLCGACKEVCPVRIDIPRLLLELRAEAASTGRLPAWLGRGIRAYTAAALAPTRWRLMWRLAGTGGRLVSRDGWIRRLPFQGAAWTDHRDLPRPASVTFHQIWSRRRGA
jgi:L-lactate dehydrogenase complex protein LldF